MSVSTLESESAQPVVRTQNSELIHRLGNHPPFPQTPFAACQRLLAMLVAVTTSALLVCQALDSPAQDTQHIISALLFASGVASIIQVKTWGPVGSGLLSVQGTSFNLVALLIMDGTASRTGDIDVPTMMTALFGTLMLTSCTEMVASRVLYLARRIITPLISGVVVMTIGLPLTQVGLTSTDGSYAVINDNIFGIPKSLLLVGVVLTLIILLNRQRNPYLHAASPVTAMAAGYTLTWSMDTLPGGNEPTTQELIMMPTPLYYGPGIEWSLLLPLMLAFIITSLETIDDITVTSDASEQSVSGPLYIKRLKDGVLANDLNSFVSAVFNTFPGSYFGQNDGMIQLTGVASHYVGFVVALMLIVLGLFSVVSGLVQHILEPVLGDATLVMSGTIAASGVRIVSHEPLSRRAILIIVLSLAVSPGVSQQPLILQFVPEWLRNLLPSGITTGGITTIVLNLIFPPEKR